MSFLRGISVVVMTMLALLTAQVAAQIQARPARISVVAGENEAKSRAILDAFRAGLRELGQIEGRTYMLDIQYAEGRLDRLPELVTNAVSRGADAIVVGSYPGILAAKRATSKIPMTGFSCGLELLVESLAHPTCRPRRMDARGPRGLA